MDIRLIKFRTRIEKAENGTLLRACIEAQKTRNMDYEKKCQEIINTSGGYDPAAPGTEISMLKDTVLALRTWDMKSQRARLQKKVTKTTGLYVSLLRDNYSVKRPVYIELNPNRTQAISIIFCLRSGNPQLAAL